MFPWGGKISSTNSYYKHCYLGYEVFILDSKLQINVWILQGVCQNMEVIFLDISLIFPWFLSYFPWSNIGPE